MLIEPQAAFEKFAAARQAEVGNLRRDGRLSNDTLTTYRSVWNLWSDWLAVERLNWQAAGAADMQRFLLTPQTRAYGAAQTSEVTKRRYWRILRDVYQVALYANQAEANVFANPWDVGARELEERAKSMVLRAPEMRRLRAKIEHLLDGLESFHAGGHRVAWMEVRDVALLALLFSTAAKVSEIKMLRPDHVLLRTDSGTGNEGGIRYVKLETHRAGAHKVRKLALDAVASRALTLWREVRAGAALEPGTALFIGATRTGAMSAVGLNPATVFRLVGRFVSETLPDHHMLHVGPESIRNSVIWEWMRAGVAETKILDDAGVQDSKILRRLERAC